MVKDVCRRIDLYTEKLMTEATRVSRAMMELALY